MRISHAAGRSKKGAAMLEYRLVPRTTVYAWVTAEWFARKVSKLEIEKTSKPLKNTATTWWDILRITSTL
jgi:hypothetical protein